MNPLKVIIYDCDGVLFESHQANLAYYNRIFSAFGYPQISDPLSAEAHICHTASSPVVLAKLMAVPDVAPALQFAQGIDYRDFIHLMSESAGLKASLTRLADNFTLAVATNRGNSMHEILEYFALGHFFKRVVTSRDVKSPKPAPDMLLLAARNLGVLPHSCLFVGDSELDQQAAAAGDIPFIAYGDRLVTGTRVGTHTELADILLNSTGVLSY
ncbi:HAD family hydrolase [Geopsychrobacter electrodiphilus]|uniref:HAD family hydrolase n=1 Tax=Geopsychrobacter electrodiphilus TaxID=225196 RepID=UPI0003601400|nr:HAD family hydrolase [Geopsychrobacter electrodiphilus]